MKNCAYLYFCGASITFICGMFTGRIKEDPLTFGILIFYLMGKAIFFALVPNNTEKAGNK
jgi:hypothetical protein